MAADSCTLWCMAIAVTTLVFLLDVVSRPAKSTVDGDVGMAAIAEGSSRPVECMSSADKRQRVNVWEAAREPSAPLYCQRLARGYGELSSSPALAYREAESAAQLLAARAAPWVLKARASRRLGERERAIAEFEKARALDAHVLDEPAALRDWAAVLASSGKTEAALAAYRALGPRLSLVFGTEEQSAILVEAAEVAASLGRAGMEDAVAFLEGARQLPVRTGRARVLAQLALALDWLGDEVQARSVADLVPRRADGRPMLEGTESGTSELDAAVALVAESSAMRHALDGWTRYLGGPGGTGPWAAHAARHRDELLRRAPGAKRGAPGNRGPGR